MGNLASALCFLVVARYRPAIESHRLTNSQPAKIYAPPRGMLHDSLAHHDPHPDFPPTFPLLGLHRLDDVDVDLLVYSITEQGSRAGRGDHDGLDGQILVHCGPDVFDRRCIALDDLTLRTRCERRGDFGRGADKCVGCVAFVERYAQGRGANEA